MYRHVIWDFDGTLFDTYPSMTSAMISALSMRGLSASEDEVYPLLKITTGHAKRFFKDKYGLGDDFDEDFARIRREIEVGMSFPYPGVVELLRDIVAAGGYSYICTHRSLSTYKFLEHHGLTGLFRGCVTADDGFALKPAPDSVEFLLDKYGIDPAEAIMVGDRELDVKAGQNAGICGCAYSDGSGAPIPCADVTARDMNELRGILLGR